MTDHRAEAKAFLRSAASGDTQRESIEFALIGIGHALLAQSATPPEPEPIEELHIEDFAGRTDAERLLAAYAYGRALTRKAVIGTIPPVSPSED